MDIIVKEGLLFLQGVKFGKKTWRRTWVILFQPSSSGIGRIELYDVRDAWGTLGNPTERPPGLKRAEKRVVRLTDCLSINAAPEESCPADCSAFYLSTTQRTYTLAALTCEDWVHTLCQLAFPKSDGNSDTVQRDDGTPSMAENELYQSWNPDQYQVTVQNSEASVRCNLSGCYLLSPRKEAICLLNLLTAQTIYCWPYRFLRRFSLVKGAIRIEAGRRCHTGEGQFIFLSKQGPQIYRAIEEAIEQQSTQGLESKATSLPYESSSQTPTPKPAVYEMVRGSLPDGNNKPVPAPRKNISLPNAPVKSPMTEPDSVLYATIELHPRPPRGLPERMKMHHSLPTYCPPDSKEERDEYMEEERHMYVGDEERDFAFYSNWLRPEVEAQQVFSSTECLYSTVHTPLQQRKTPAEEASPGVSAGGHCSPIHVNFKQKLSNLLFKDQARIQPPFPSADTESTEAIYHN